jgi:hypothetical protein
MKQSELKKMMQKVVEKNKKLVECFEKNENPQVLEMLVRARAKLELAEDVLGAIDNNPVLLRIEGKL